MTNPPAPEAAATPAQNPFAGGCAWIDGEFSPIREARIPILDAGFLRSDVTYDVVAVWEGRFFRIEDHLDRVLASCRALRLDPEMSREQLRELMFECVRRSGLQDSYVEIIVTRGVPRSGDRDLRNWRNRVYVYAIPYLWIVSPEQQERGTDIVVSRDTRRYPSGSFDPLVKNFQWGDFTRSLLEAYDRDAQLSVLTDGEGHITEGPGFNIFAVLGRELVTAERGVLQGITRKTVLEIAAGIDLEVVVGDLQTSRLYEAAEIFLTSTAGGVMPVASLDGEPVGSGTAGPVTREIKDTYWDLHRDPALTDPVDYTR
jgi:branched-subunit amino acid aminotransferase/4-amino-4-deoxychorismate lyase